MNSRLWLHIPVKRKRQAIYVLLLMIFTSLTEVLSIGALMPFLAVLSNPDNILKHSSVLKVMKILRVGGREEMLLILTVVFVFAALVAGLMRSILSWATMRLAYGCGADLSLNIYRRTLYQPYKIHISRNSSEIINSIVTKVNGVINNNILPALTLVSSLVMFVSIFLVLLLIDPEVTIMAMMGFSLVYLMIIILTRRAKFNNGVRISKGSTQLVKTLQEGLGGIRDILLDGTQKIYCDKYQKVDSDLRFAQGMNQFLAQSPRFLIEALGMALIAMLAYYMLSAGKNIPTIIPVLGALAIGAQRMLPIMQQAYAAWSSIQGGKAVLNDTLHLLEQPLPSCANDNGSKLVEFKKTIELSNVSFKYESNGLPVLESINLAISRGERIGVIGSTGSGKSTLVDIVMGFLYPDSGVVIVDDRILGANNIRGWQNQIAHVPQSIYLADASIEQNIAFGKNFDEIDSARVVEAAKKAQIADFINQLPEGYKTSVGERGVRLSGGQRQRLGIARALYKKSAVIVLDEATSALDNETEAAVMSAVRGLDKDLTLIIIAHRLSTLSLCDRVIKLDGGKIVSIDDYKTIISNNY